MVIKCLLLLQLQVISFGFINGHAANKSFKSWLDNAVALVPLLVMLSLRTSKPSQSEIRVIVVVIPTTVLQSSELLKVSVKPEALPCLAMHEVQHHHVQVLIESVDMGSPQPQDKVPITLMHMQ